MIDLLKANGGENIKVFGGGGGVIVPSEIKELHAYGVTRIYAPEDGVKMGLQGMINEVVQKSDFDVAAKACRRRTGTGWLRAATSACWLARHHPAGKRRGAGLKEPLLKGGCRATKRRFSALPVPAAPASRR